MSSNLLSEAAKVNLDSASCLSRLSIDSSLETSPFSSSVRFRTCAFTTGQRSLSILAQHGWSLAMQHIFFVHCLIIGPLRSSSVVLIMIYDYNYYHLYLHPDHPNHIHQAVDHHRHHHHPPPHQPSGRLQPAQGWPWQDDPPVSRCFPAGDMI